MRVAASRSFRNSPRLRELLLYVAECAIRNAPEDATEQQVGMHVFGRPAGYNSSEDSIVRSHARLLRQKLAVYFESEGADEALRIEVPKGHYLLVFTPKDSPVDVLPAPPAMRTPLPEVVPEPPPFQPARTRFKPMRRPAVLWMLAAIAAAALLTTAALLLLPTSRVSGPVASLWHPFLTSEPPLLIYSNGIFVGDSKTGMRYATAPELQRSADDARLIDHYTGIGEVASVYDLTQFFDAAHASFILKRSHLVTWDEAKLRNLIFIGSPAENLALQALPPDTDFTLVSSPEASGYRNNHPRHGEQAAYMRPEHPLTQDYALVALLPGMQAGKRMIMLSGLTTLGTQAAVEYAIRPEGAAELMKAATGRDHQVRPFQAILQTTIIGGVPLNTRLVTIHVH